MTMFAFNRNVFQPVRPEMQLFIALYRVLMNGPLVEFAAYWADSQADAREAAVSDLKVMHPELAVHTTGFIAYYPTADDKARYHGPDFTGRKAWLVFDSEEGLRHYLQSGGKSTEHLLYGIAADDYEQAMLFDPEPFIEHRVCIVGFDWELDHLEEGWDK